MRTHRLALLPVLIAVYVLVAEAGLQIAAFFIQRATRAELPVAWITGNLRVLCLGDSNTYGIWVDRSQAYPQQLEVLWNEHFATPKLEVLNLGFPGTNSSRLVRDLPRLLDTFEPDILILMVGVNDFWTLPFSIDEAREVRPQKGYFARHSLIYRLYYLIRRGLVADEVEMDPNGSSAKGADHKARVGDLEFDMGYAAATPGLAGDGIALEQNLRRLVEQAQAAGTSVYLMNYASRQGFYTRASRAITTVALETGVSLIDLKANFEQICPSDGCPDILFPDGHPTAPGYRIVAEAIMKRLAEKTSP